LALSQLTRSGATRQRVETISSTTQHPIQVLQGNSYPRNAGGMAQQVTLAAQGKFDFILRQAMTSRRRPFKSASPTAIPLRLNGANKRKIQFTQSQNCLN
jgi:hypothetical protein